MRRIVFGLVFFAAFCVMASLGTRWADAQVEVMADPALVISHGYPYRTMLVDAGRMTAALNELAVAEPDLEVVAVAPRLVRPRDGVTTQYLVLLHAR